MFIDESLTAKGYTPASTLPNSYFAFRRIESITIHWWGAYGQTHDGVCNFFANGPGTTSAHFVASAGRVNCLVSPSDIAWHSGNNYGNCTSIGIECRPEASDEDYQTVAELIKYLRDQYGDLPLIPHRDWQSTDCPGIWDLNRLDNLARGITQEEELDAEAKAWIKETRDRVLGRDQQRWFNPQTLEVRFDNFAGAIPARSSDIHDIISTNNLLVAQTNKILDAISHVPGITPEVIAGLREELTAELKAATANLSVTLSTNPT